MKIIHIAAQISLMMLLGCSASVKIPKTESGEKPELSVFIAKVSHSSMNEQHLNRLNQIQLYLFQIIERDASKHGFNVREVSSIDECDAKRSYCLTVRIKEYIPVDRSHQVGAYIGDQYTAPHVKREMRYNGSMEEVDNLQKNEKATLDLDFDLKNNYELNAKSFKYPLIMQDLNWKQCVIRSSKAFFEEYFIAASLS